jgi:putative drug exporter of the RND superfamily
MLKGSASCSERCLAVSSLARLCFRRRFAVLGGWILLLVTLAAAALSVGPAFTNSTTLPNSESATAYTLLAKAGIGQSPSGASTQSGEIVWHTTGTAISDARVQKDASTMLAAVAALPGVEAVVSPYTPTGARQINPSVNTAFASVVVDPTADITQIRATADTMAGTSVQVAAGGQAFTTLPAPSHGIEGVGLLAALVVLVLLFRSPWAAALPIITGITGVGTSLLVVMLASNVVTLADTSITMGALIGLGVGIDYALFIVNRHRKALLAGASIPDAIRIALNTSGRAVIFAGVTVIIALLGMFVVNLGALTGMSQAAAVTVLFTVAAAITLLPALLAILGHRVLSRRQRRTLLTGQDQRPANGHRASLPTRWALLVQRAPRRFGALALLLLVLVASPVASMRVGAADASSDPAGSAGRTYYDLMSPAFGEGVDAPLVLVARTPDAASTRAFATLVSDLSTVKNVAAVIPVPARAGTAMGITTVIPATSAQTAATQDLVNSLRDTVIPAAEAGTGLQVYVGGTTATSIDLSQALMNKLPLYLALIAVLGFLLLAMAFRSLLVPLLGALSNVATIFVGLGAITAIFQYGWGSSLLGVGSGAPVFYFVPVIIVGVMFGLSMDYQVFLVSRMHEEWTHTRDNARAIRVGVSETGQVIAAAATIMLCVFASFSFGGERIVAAIGIGMAIAILVDAFVIRMTLMPALMKLIGARNWYYPAWAERITPRLSVEGPAELEVDNDELDVQGAQVPATVPATMVSHH